ncbi:MAG: hypothetical protein N3A68_03060 [Bacteroidia bacterium]|nr:hypothetical protein [Bacteroidia bacterium]
MRRLQRYLRRLSETEWRSLWEEAQRELGPKTQKLLYRLRVSLAPVGLSLSEKELAQRAERWLWRRAFLEKHQKHPLRTSPPSEWVLTGAELYRKVGLSKEAIALLQRLPEHPLEALRFVFRRFRWEAEAGHLTQSSRTLRKIEGQVRQLLLSVERQRLQLLFHRLLHEHGGSYTQAAQRLLRRLQRLTRWSQSLPASPDELATEINLRILYALACGDGATALEYCERALALVPVSYHNTFRLNGWLCTLMARKDLREATRWASSLVPPLTAHEKAVYLYGILFTFLVHASPGFIRRHQQTLRLWAEEPQLYKEESQFLWGQLLWLMGQPREGAEVLESLLLRRRVPLFLRLQVHVLLPLIYKEAREPFQTVRAFHKGLQFLRKFQPRVASAVLLVALMKKLYQARLHPVRMQEAVRQWEKHLQAFPAEKLSWSTTILPEWIKAQLAGQRIELHRTTSSAGDALCEQLIQQSIHLLR